MAAMMILMIVVMVVAFSNSGHHSMMGDHRKTTHQETSLACDRNKDDAACVHRPGETKPETEKDAATLEPQE